MNTKKHSTKAQSLPSGDSATYVTRPKGKPEVTTKGKLNEYSNGYKEFIPQGQKPSNRTMVKQLGNSSFYKSEGEKESSWSLHLNVDAKDCDDPVGALYEQFNMLTQEQRKTEPKLPEGMQGRMLFDNGQGLQVWLNTEKGKVNILTTLDCSPDIERQLLQAQSMMNVTLGRYRQEILKVKSEE